MSTLLVVNPNTSAEMTERIGETARAIAGPDTEIVAVRPETGPRSLESFYEYHLAAIGTFEVVAEYAGSVDAVVVACYGDPGLYPLKELLDVPVVGVAEASMATATLLGERFSILVALAKAVPMMENLARWYGFDPRLASVEATGRSVLDLEEDEEGTLADLAAAGERARAAGAEVLVLGCSGMAGMENRLTERTGLPVIDPVANAVAAAELLLAQRLSQSRTGLYERPPKKEIRGEMAGDVRDLF